MAYDSSKAVEIRYSQMRPAYDIPASKVGGA